MNSVPPILARLAHILGTTIAHGRLEIPTEFGQGTCTGFVFNEHIRLLISDYSLHADLALENPEANTGKRMLFFKFQNVFANGGKKATEQRRSENPSVLIATSRINTDDVIAIHSNIATITIEVEASYLHNMLNLSGQSTVVQSLLEDQRPLLFEQLIYPSLQKVVDEILREPISDSFQLFFLRIKAEELVCRLLMELEKRSEKQLYALNSTDVRMLYNVKERILEHLDKPPLIKELALAAGMSPTKLKRLFRQVFGNSLFNYYQEFRMQEAARLLKDENLTVSEAGYHLGFSNLSHFSRVFRVHVGMNPKEYSRL